jgi:hypothetical protein
MLKSAARSHPKGPAPTHTDAEYLAFDPGAGDDFPAEVECRKTALVVTRKEHTCFGWKGDMQHKIPPGTRVYRESGKCEGHFGTVYMCLPCVDISLEPEWW